MLGIRRWRVAAIVGLGVAAALAGCKKAAPPPVKKAATAPKKQAVRPEPPASSAPARQVDAMKADPFGIPPASFSRVSLVRYRRSNKANAKGMRLHRKKRYAAAAPLFLEAIAANPGNVIARFNLGCAHARLGDADRALHVLGQLKSAGCPACLDLVKRALADRDFIKLRKDGQLRALTAGIVVKEPDYRAAARKFYEEIRTGKREMLLATVRSGRMFTDEVTDRNGEISRAFVYGEDAAKKFDFAGDVYPLRRASCNSRCCTVSVKDDGSLSGPASSVYTLDTLCFWPLTDQIALPVSMSGTMSQPEA